MSIDLTADEKDMAHRTAVRMSGKYRDFTETADVEQELLAWMLGKDEKLRQWRAEDGGWRALNASLYREARRFCEKEKALSSGYKPEDQAHYSRGIVHELLPSALMPDGEWAFDDSIDGRPDSVAANMVIDVRDGLSKLPAKDARVLAIAVDNEWDFPYMAVELGCTAAAARMRADRAVRKLASILNNSSDERALRMWQRQFYKTVPRYSSSEIIRLQRNAETIERDR